MKTVLAGMRGKAKTGASRLRKGKTGLQEDVINALKKRAMSAHCPARITS